ncbi:MAG: hypothetical protein KDJ26_04780 [Alphaproteobacteria bacterium]|nr:hypothetical protein [Alphaproteobacteria bacterium]MCB1551300.1 hypothetical protein [Alphaproteobacteria bacterium]MCB9985410.1 hypothetical protein [Micavibrio sp.]HPQ51229.1 hypothetical protein [Alphaproteobacteria bacterium]
MFKWIKKKGTSPPSPTLPETSGRLTSHETSREAIIDQANKNARDARKAIGQERLNQLNELIRQKQQEEISPAAQARKIIAQMDTDKISDHLRYLRNEPPTKH